MDEEYYNLIQDILNGKRSGKAYKKAARRAEDERRISRITGRPMPLTIRGFQADLLRDSIPELRDSIPGLRDLQDPGGGPLQMILQESADNRWGY